MTAFGAARCRELDSFKLVVAVRGRYTVFRPGGRYPFEYTLACKSAPGFDAYENENCKLLMWSPRWTARTPGGSFVEIQRLLFDRRGQSLPTQKRQGAGGGDHAAPGLLQHGATYKNEPTSDRGFFWSEPHFTGDLPGTTRPDGRGAGVFSNRSYVVWWPGMNRLPVNPAVKSGRGIRRGIDGEVLFAPRYATSTAPLPHDSSEHCDPACQDPGEISAH
ncbi:hypothetical protein C8R47DRAFT_1072527 [Mycena vitilis]|nr:hypothetical protein C8R47DRAFT_1072527 [Mycena vitilis]